MHIIKEPILAGYARKYAHAALSLEHWRIVAQDASWQSLAEVRAAYADTDAVKVKSGGALTIFGIVGNRFRLVTATHRELIFILGFLTLAEYNHEQLERTIVRKTDQPFARGIPESYEALCRVQIPRPIHDKVTCEKSLKVIDALIGRKLNRDQQDYLEAISLFVHRYEQRSVVPPRIEPLGLLSHLLEENGLSRKDLAGILGVDLSNAARILKGTRSITPAHAKRLGERFKVRPSLFLALLD
jgi:HTH-type transcriptional regulator / antitoxin HigA